MAKTSQIRFPRVRMLTIAEIVGICALAVAALGYWDSHRERVAAEKAQEADAAARALRQSFVMKGEVADKGGVLRLAPIHADQVIQTQTLWFPKDVRADKVETTGDPRLEADWLADGVRRAAEKSKASTGRVPVVVVTEFVEDGQTRTDQSVYQVAYSLHHRLLQADQVKLEGLSLARRNVPGDPQASADKLWGK
jgi:hypothetical protein